MSVTGFLTPSSVWLADASTGAATTIKTLPAQFDASGDTVEQLEATSTDGTKIPYFVVHPKDMKRDGTNPTILNAYGGFEVSETPRYSGHGRQALARARRRVRAGEHPRRRRVRPGVARGRPQDAPPDRSTTISRAWRRISIARKITSTATLGIMGGSNGGLLMGVEFTEHPDYWGAVDIQVPLLDMLRYEQIDAGASWVGEYGSVSVPAERAFWEKMSPYENLRKDVHYPEPLIWTTTKDDRVGPQHARKFAAKMAAQGHPYLFYEVTEGGHGAGANLREQAHTSALEYHLLRAAADALSASPGVRGPSSVVRRPSSVVRADDSETAHVGDCDGRRGLRALRHDGAVGRASPAI